MKSFVKKAAVCLTGFATVIAASAATAAPYAAGNGEPLSSFSGYYYIEDEAVPLADAPTAVIVPASAVTPVVSVSAPGTFAAKNGNTIIDYSNSKDGYVMAKYSGQAKLKVRIKGPATTYTYDLQPNKWEAFPLSEGNGTYNVSVFRCVQDNKYVSELAKNIDVVLIDEKAPFTHSNQYVDYDSAPNAVAKAAELTADKAQTLEKVCAVYDFVVSNIAYDYEFAKVVQSGYLPALDKVLENKKGICFDYASLMTGMLRSQGIPTKLVIGYAGTVYHAWISIWVDGQGWVDGAIYFDGTKWTRLDPTFASTSNRSNSIMEYIKNDANYSIRYCY